MTAVCARVERQHGAAARSCHARAVWAHGSCMGAARWVQTDKCIERKRRSRASAIAIAAQRQARLARVRGACDAAVQHHRRWLQTQRASAAASGGGCMLHGLRRASAAPTAAARAAPAPSASSASSTSSTMMSDATGAVLERREERSANTCHATCHATDDAPTIASQRTPTKTHPKSAATTPPPMDAASVTSSASAAPSGPSSASPLRLASGGGALAAGGGSGARACDASHSFSASRSALDAQQATALLSATALTKPRHGRFVVASAPIWHHHRVAADVCFGVRRRRVRRKPSDDGSALVRVPCAARLSARFRAMHVSARDDQNPRNGHNGAARHAAASRARCARLWTPPPRGLETRRP
jgi:hypothetical protein